MTLLCLTDVTVTRGARPVVNKASLSIGAGELVGLIGPNGAGKTSLMRAALGLLNHQGHSSLAVLSPAQRARHAAWLPQTREIAWPVTVETLVALGRLPHLGSGQSLAPQDRDAVARALVRTDLTWAAQRRVTELSGGEQARALLARALAQETPLLLADEPVAGLDPSHAIAAMDAFAALAEQGHGVLVALHDLALAARHCTRLVVMRKGEIVGDGPPAEILSGTVLRNVFGVRGEFVHRPEGPSLIVTGLADG